MEEKSLIEQSRLKSKYIKALDIARNMIAENIPMQFISRLMDLYIKTVKG